MGLSNFVFLWYSPKLHWMLAYFVKFGIQWKKEEILKVVGLNETTTRRKHLALKANNIKITYGLKSLDHSKYNLWKKNLMADLFE